ncbi:MAG: tyrosyl-tRNA synthetase [Cellvibrionaceae bacterium]
MIKQSGLLADLKARGLIAQMTSEESLAEMLNEPQVVYCGFDPTADSLHIGSLVPLLTLKRFQQAGHTPIVLVGGATGLIGDPSFKSQERQLNTPEVVASWVSKIKAQTSQLINFSEDGTNAAAMANNLDWMSDFNILDFLRDVGKHFSINNMINKESVKQRINREGEGISFTEFAYMLLQSYDFAELYRRHRCVLQIGGSDQWGNIVGGVDLTRRMHGAHVYGLTLPLVTKADGTKFGKTESGTIWLDPKKTSPYAFYQFWLNAADADVYKFLKYFTFLSVDDIDKLERMDKDSGTKPQAQKVLAQEVTRLVHGDDGLRAAEVITRSLFDGSVGGLSVTNLMQLEQDGLPSSELDASLLADNSLTSLFVTSDLAKNSKQVKDALMRNAVLVNGAAVGWDMNMEVNKVFSIDNGLHEKWFIVRLGKKSYHLFKLV